MYFDTMQTEGAIKDRYRLLAKRLHPDTGGDKAIMQEINREYENALKRLHNPSYAEKPKPKQKPKPEPKEPEDSMSPMQKIDMIMVWSRKNLDFDTGFVESVRDWIDSGRSITPNQQTALNRIIKRFRITQ